VGGKRKRKRNGELVASSSGSGESTEDEERSKNWQRWREKLTSTFRNLWSPPPLSTSLGLLEVAKGKARSDGQVS